MRVNINPLLRHGISLLPTYMFNERSAWFNINTTNSANKFDLDLALQLAPTETSNEAYYNFFKHTKSTATTGINIWNADSSNAGQTSSTLITHSLRNNSHSWLMVSKPGEGKTLIVGEETTNEELSNQNISTRASNSNSVLLIKRPVTFDSVIHLPTYSSSQISSLGTSLQEGSLVCNSDTNRLKYKIGNVVRSVPYTHYVKTSAETVVANTANETPLEIISLPILEIKDIVDIDLSGLITNSSVTVLNCQVLFKLNGTTVLSTPLSSIQISASSKVWNANIKLYITSSSNLNAVGQIRCSSYISSSLLEITSSLVGSNYNYAYNSNVVGTFEAYVKMSSAISNSSISLKNSTCRIL